MRKFPPYLSQSYDREVPGLNDAFNNKKNQYAEEIYNLLFALWRLIKWYAAWQALKERHWRSVETLITRVSSVTSLHSKMWKLAILQSISLRWSTEFQGFYLARLHASGFNELHILQQIFSSETLSEHTQPIGNNVTRRVPTCKSIQSGLDTGCNENYSCNNYYNKL